MLPHNKVIQIGSDAPLISGATTSTLSYNLFQDIISNPERWTGETTDFEWGTFKMVSEPSNFFGFYQSVERRR